MTRRGRVWIGLLVAAVGLALAPAGARAATVFGADLTQTPGFTTADFSLTNVIAPGGGPDNGAPVSGVLVSVRVRTTGAAGTGKIRVLTETAHPDASTYEFLNTAPEINVPFTGDLSSPGHITQVLTRRPIVAGQRLAWYLNDPDGNTYESYVDNTSQCAFTFGGAAHTPGTQVNYSTTVCDSTRVLLSGTIEADADGDGYGDETQDRCPTSSTVQGACPATYPLPTAKKKCKKKKKGRAGAVAAKKKKCKKKGK